MNIRIRLSILGFRRDQRTVSSRQRTCLWPSSSRVDRVNDCSRTKINEPQVVVLFSQQQQHKDEPLLRHTSFFHSDFRSFRRMKVNTFVVASKLLLLNTSLLLGVEGKRESPFASVLTVRQGKQQDTIAGLSLTRTLADSETKGDPMAQRKLNTNALDTLHEVWTAASTTSASVQSSCEKSKSKASKAPTGSKGPKATKGPKKSKGRKSSKAPSVKGSHKGRCTAPAPTAPGTVTAPTPGTTVSTPRAGSTPSLNTARCAAVAGETLVTSLTGTTFDVNLGMVIASSVVTAGMTENAIDATRNGFQSGTAPGLTTCGDDRRRGRSRLLADTTVENVVFGDIDSTGFGEFDFTVFCIFHGKHPLT